MSTKFTSKRAPAVPIGYKDLHDDPLSQALMPPEDESPEDRALRVEKQQEATRISREIDESIQESRKAYEKRKKAIKVLLLGESLNFLSGGAFRSSSLSSRSGRIGKEYYFEEFVQKNRQPMIPADLSYRLSACLHAKSLSIRKGCMENNHSAQSYWVSN
jgi:hypothetical protein